MEREVEMDVMQKRMRMMKMTEEPVQKWKRKARQPWASASVTAR